MPATPSSEDANFITGNTGLIAVDKIGNKVLFLDPATYETVLTLSGFAPRVHELGLGPQPVGLGVDEGAVHVPQDGGRAHGGGEYVVGHVARVYEECAGLLR